MLFLYLIVEKKCNHRAEVIKDQHITQSSMPARHEGLMKLIGGGVKDSQEPGEDVIPLRESAKIGKREQTITKPMRGFFYEVIPTAEIGKFIRGA